MVSKFNRALCGIIFAALTGAAIQGGAQALPTVQRGAEFDGFAQGTMLSPDWGQTHDYGFSLGLDYTRFISRFVQPGLEARFSRATGRTVNENTYLGGLKLQTSIHGIHPYALVLAGRGTLQFNYTGVGVSSENFFVLGVGGGAEFNLTRSLKLRGDVVSQHWNVAPDALTPAALNVGVSYVLPIHGRRRR